MINVLAQKAQLLMIMRNRLREVAHKEQEQYQLETGVIYSFDEVNELEQDGFDKMEYEKDEIYERNVRLERIRNADDNL